jgi:REP element-mobilizing transposase RayT
MRQKTFDFPVGWGGRRKGAGRKPKGVRAGVPHRRKGALAARFPVHVTTRVGPGLASLRRRGEQAVLRGAFRSGCERFGFRLVQYAVLGNHLHFVVEARDRRALFRGLVGLLTRIARRLNRWWERRGKVFPDRFHERILRTPREVRRVLSYVLHNVARHGWRVPSDRPDPCSSGRWFDGWRDYQAPFPEPRPVALAHTWLLRVGWRRHRLIALSDATPAARSP